MAEKSIAAFLKQLRKTSGESVGDVVDRLKEYDIDISVKTLYGYESGLSMPNANVFVALCRIYKCDNPMEIFGNPSLSHNESLIIEKYRDLDAYGQETINYILDRETERVKQLRETGNNSLRSAGTRIYPYVHKIACAGTGFYFDDIPTDTIELPFVPGADFVIGVNGDSMEPDYHDGELLYVEKVPDLAYEEVGIFTIGNECYLKEYSPDGLRSRNPEYDDIPGDEDIRLIGKVIGKVGE